MTLNYNKDYRDPELARRIVDRIHSSIKGPMRIMEVCGTHTMSIFRHGIRSLLPPDITLLSGPGCPVCVTAQKDIDAFVALSQYPDTIITTFGDLIKVPGSGSSLGKEKSKGADVRIVYSIFDAVKLAEHNPDKKIVFCGIGFETTIPTLAGGLLMAGQAGLDNFFMYTAAKLTPPALEALMQTQRVSIDGFLLPGHVSVITGTQAFQNAIDACGVPAVIAGFEPIDILSAVLRLVQEHGQSGSALYNLYPRAVSDQGNLKAKQIMEQVFEPCGAVWRGIGTIPDSGMAVKEQFTEFDAALQFEIRTTDRPEPAGCLCGKILMGLRTPEECALYKKQCTPMTPVGPCMVSSEGSCAAFYKYQ